MRFSYAVATLASAAAVVAEDHLITVGLGGLMFQPNSITAASGDTVTFEFHPKNHSVTQSTFVDPCQQSPGGVHSGFLATPPDATSFSQWQIKIDNTATPLWFFCAQTLPAPHCHSGMVFAVNPTQDKSFEQYQVNANQSTKSFTDAGQPPQPTAQGGAGAGAQTQAGAPPSAATNGAPAPAGPVVTSSGSVPTANIPQANPALTSGGGVGAQGATQSGAPTNSTGAAYRLSGFSAVSGTIVVAGMVSLIL